MSWFIFAHHKKSSQSIPSPRLMEGYRMAGNWVTRLLVIIPYYSLLVVLVFVLIGGAWGIAAGHLIPAGGAYLMLISAALWYFFAGLHRWVFSRWPYPISIIFRQTSSNSKGL